MTHWVITRHTGAQDWLRDHVDIPIRSDTCFDSLVEVGQGDTGSLSLKQIQPGDIVTGILPLQLIEKIQARGAIYQHITLNRLPPDLRGVELTCEDMIKLKARLTRPVISARSDPEGTRKRSERKALSNRAAFKGRLTTNMWVVCLSIVALIGLGVMGVLDGNLNRFAKSPILVTLPAALFLCYGLYRLFNHYFGRAFRRIWFILLIIITLWLGAISADVIAAHFNSFWEATLNFMNGGGLRPLKLSAGFLTIPAFLALTYWVFQIRKKVVEIEYAALVKGDDKLGRSCLLFGVSKPAYFREPELDGTALQAEAVANALSLETQNLFEKSLSSKDKNRLGGVTLRSPLMTLKHHMDVWPPSERKLINAHLIYTGESEDAKNQFIDLAIKYAEFRQFTIHFAETRIEEIENMSEIQSAITAAIKRFGTDMTNISVDVTALNAQFSIAASTAAIGSQFTYAGRESFGVYETKFTVFDDPYK